MLNITATYPGKTAGTNADYPGGQARDVVASGDGTGTPWTAAVLNDVRGFMEAALAGGGITRSGASETALASDVIDALVAMFGMPTLHLSGLRQTWDSIALQTVGPGSARNLADTRGMVLPAAIQKNITTTWSPGNGGGLPSALLPVTIDTWYRRFLVERADGSAVDWAYDTSPTAANFFADAAAIADGYTDVTRYRRFGWTWYVTAGILKHSSPEDDPRRYVWDVSVPSQFMLEPVSGFRQSMIPIGDLAPPNSLGQFTYIISEGNLLYILITDGSQSDVAVGSTNYTVSAPVTSINSNTAHNIDVMTDGSGDIFYRAHISSGGVSSKLLGRGWVDNGIIP
jgi:hypothetical protein